jgi:hypothetical protein
VPQPVTSDELLVDGHPVQASVVGNADGPHASVLRIPELETVISGDVIYNNIHMWRCGDPRRTPARDGSTLSTPSPRCGRPQSSPATRIQRLPTMTPGASSTSRGATSTDFNRAVEQSTGPMQIIDSMLSRYPDLGNPYTLWLSAQGQEK